MHPAAYAIIVLIIMIILEILIFNSIYLTPKTREAEGWRLWTVVGVTLLLFVFGGATAIFGMPEGKRRALFSAKSRSAAE